MGNWGKGRRPLNPGRGKRPLHPRHACRACQRPPSGRRGSVGQKGGRAGGRCPSQLSQWSQWSHLAPSKLPVWDHWDFWDHCDAPLPGRPKRPCALCGSLCLCDSPRSERPPIAPQGRSPFFVPGVSFVVSISVCLCVFSVPSVIFLLGQKKRPRRGRGFWGLACRGYSATMARRRVTSTPAMRAMVRSLVPRFLMGSASLTMAGSTATPASVRALAMSAAVTEP